MSKTRQRLLWLPLIFFSSMAIAEETHQLVQRIKGIQYKVEYRVSADGSVSAEPTHIQTTVGWVTIDKGASFVAIDSKGTEQVVKLGNREVSVRFSQKGIMKVAGEVYAVKGQSGEWIPGNISSLSAYAAKPPTPSSQNFSRAPGTQKSTTVAEFRLYEPAIRGVRMSARETIPRQVEGITEYPDVRFSVSPRINDSANSLGVGIQIKLTGSAKATAGEVGPLGKWTGATVRSHVAGNYQRDFYVSPDGIAASPLRGQATVTPEISVGTQIRAPLLKRIAKRAAARQASSAVASKLPERRRQLSEEVERATSEAASAANQIIHDNINKLSRFSFANQIPLDLRLSSHANQGSPGYLSATLATKKAFDASPRPELSVAGQAATLHVHQSAINEVISPLLAGDEINLGEAMKRICSDALMQQLPICSEKLDPEIEKLVVVFDKEKPFEILFQDGKISVRLNLSHDLLKSGNGEKEVAFKGSPYSIVTTYSVSNEGLKRDQVRVEPKGAAVASKENKKEESHSTFSFLNRALRATAKSVAGVAEQAKLQEAYEKAFVEKIEFKRVLLPQAVHIKNPTAKTAPVVTQSREYYSSQVKAEKGWFAMAFGMGPALK